MAKTKKSSTLLSLSTIAPDPQYIHIEDKELGANYYEILLLDQLGIKEQARLGSMASRAEAIKMGADLTDETVDDLVDLYRTLVKAVMPDLPAALLAKLPIQHLQAIVVVFTEASGIMIPTDETAEVTDQK